MRLRIVTTGLFITGIILTLCFPFFVGKRPPLGPGHVHELARYTVRFGLYVTGLILLFFSVVACAAAVMRRSRQEYREESRKNLESLIEGTLRDHRRGAGDEPESAG